MQDPNQDKSPQNEFEEDEDVEVEQLNISDGEQEDNSNLATRKTALGGPAHHHEFDMEDYVPGAQYMQK